MACPSHPNQITSLDIFNEHVSGTSQNLQISDYYAVGRNVSSGSLGYPMGVSTLIPSQGEISYGNFHGSRRSSMLMYFMIVGGGGAGGAGRRDRSGGAGGGGGGGGITTTFFDVPLVNLYERPTATSITVGAGGNPNYSFEATSGYNGGASFLKISPYSWATADQLPNGVGYQMESGGGLGGGGNSGAGGRGGYGSFYGLGSPGGSPGGGAGSSSPNLAGGGGGGADDRTHGSYNRGGDGVIFVANNIRYGGGGGGGGDGGDGGYNGGAGGGGSGKSSANGDQGTDNLGGGGGGGASWGNDSWSWGGRGGNGVVIVAYPKVYGRRCSGGTETEDATFFYHSYTTVGSGYRLTFL